MSGDPIRMSPPVAAGLIVPAARRAIALGMLAAFAACSSAPVENFYTLSAVAAPERAHAPNPVPAVTIFVDVATVPELVDRPQIVVRIDDSRVSMLEQQRWAEPLKLQISRTVAMNLERLLDAARVWSTSPEAGGIAADYRVALDVQRYEVSSGDALAMDVLWVVRRAATGDARTGRSVVREKFGPGGYDALVAAHNRAFATISREIAAAIP